MHTKKHVWSVFVCVSTTNPIDTLGYCYCNGEKGGLRSAGGGTLPDSRAMDCAIWWSTMNGEVSSSQRAGGVWLWISITSVQCRKGDERRKAPPLPIVPLMVNAKKDRPWGARQDRGRYDKTVAHCSSSSSLVTEAKGVVLFVQRKRVTRLDLVRWTLWAGLCWAVSIGEIKKNI
jgi:hypothetical protein